MKLRDNSYPNMHFKNEKDKFNALYGLGEIDVSKIGFTTSGQSRGQILTKMEEVIRNNKIKIYSSRFYDEMKTFVWAGSKAQAMKGKNDDLIMSLAIGIWLYDASPKNNKHTHDLNKAMLAGFGVNSRGSDSISKPWKDKYHNPFKPQTLGSLPVSGSNTPYGDMSWVLNGR